MNNLVPEEFYLGQNYPNPFKEKTTIKYCVAYKTNIKITVFNSKGEIIEKLVDQVKEAGTYKLEFPSVECPQPNDKESEQPEYHNGKHHCGEGKQEQNRCQLSCWYLVYCLLHGSRHWCSWILVVCARH